MFGKSCVNYGNGHLSVDKSEISVLLDDIKTSGQSQKKLQKLKVLEVIHYMDRLNALKLVKNIHLFYYLLTPACGKKCLYATRSRTSSFFQIGSSVTA